MKTINFIDWAFEQIKDRTFTFKVIRFLDDPSTGYGYDAIDLYRHRVVLTFKEKIYKATLTNEIKLNVEREHKVNKAGKYMLVCYAPDGTILEGDNRGKILTVEKDELLIVR